MNTLLSFIPYLFHFSQGILFFFPLVHQYYSHQVGKGEGEKKAQTFKHKINKSWECTVQPGNYS